MISIPRVKICCIKSVEEARLAIECGASALGLVGKMPSGPGVIDDFQIYRIARQVPPPVATFLLTSETSAREIIAHYNRTLTSVIQMVDHVASAEYPLIRKALPHVKLVQVVHVIDESSVQDAIEASRLADAVLLDSGNPNLEVKQLGGTGRTHNWEISCQIREQLSVPVFLAGGITPLNVSRAIQMVHPYGIDLCNGVRTNGTLDKAKVCALFEQIRATR